MKVEFKVHGVSKGSANVLTEVEGEPITATAPCLEVELVTVSERNGSLTLRFIGAAMAEAEKLFTKDALLTADFATKVSASSEPAKV